MTVLTAYTDKDAAYYAAATTTSSTGSATIFSGYGSKVGFSQALFHMDLSSIPSTATVSAATFTYSCTAADAVTAVNHNLARCTNAWDETANTLAAALTYTDATAANTVDVTVGRKTNSNSKILTWVQGWVAGTFTNYGLAIDNNYSTSDHSADFGAREQAGTADDPLLTITYNSPPTAPGAFSSPTATTYDASLVATWTAATDPNSDTLTYYLEYSANGTFSDTTVIASALSAVTYTWNTTAIGATTTGKLRVRANDGLVYGPYTTSVTFTIQHNVAPNVPTAVGQVAPLTATTPTFTANVSDPNTSQQIKGRFQLYQSDGTTLLGTLDTSFRGGAGVVTAVYSSALSVGTYKLQAQTIDDLGLTSAYSAQVTIYVLTSANKDSTYLWNVASQTNKDSTYLWGVQSTGTKDAAFLWNVDIVLNKDFTLKWQANDPWVNVPLDDVSTGAVWTEVIPP